MDIGHVLAFVAGLLGRVFGAGLIHFYNAAILPYLSQQTYKHITIGDTPWYVEHIGKPIDNEDTESIWSVKVSLKQLGQTISGTANSTCVSGVSPGKQVTYIVNGKFSNGVLDISFNEKDSASRNRSCFLMQVIGEGNVLEGYRLFLGRNKNDIRAIKCKWVRENQVGAVCCTA